MKKYGGLLKIFILGIVLFCYAMFQGGFVSWFLFYATLPFILFSLIIYFYPKKSLHVERKLSEHDIARGQDMDVHLTVSRTDYWPLYYAKVTDIHPFSRLGLKERVLFLGFRREIHLNYSLENLPRGSYTFEGVKIELVDLLGWTRKQWFVEEKKTVMIYPRVTDLLYIPVASNYEQGNVLARYQAQKETTVATGVREYQPGDRVSWIHWKSFAKNQTLRTKDFEDRQAQDTLVYLDRTESDAFDDAVDFTLSVIQAMTKSDSTGAFRVPGKNGFDLAEVKHQGHFERAKRYLATVTTLDDSLMSRILNEDTQLAKFKGIIFITTSLHRGRMSALVKAAPQVQAGVCFVVRPRSIQLTASEKKEEAYMKARGWTVHTLSPEQFADAFGEVSGW